MTNAELAILSLIAERPRYGYEIDETIEARGMRGWTDIGFSSIYYLLKKLTGDGLLVQETRESEHGPARKVYSVTQAGITALRTGTTDALTNLDGGERDFLLGLANLPALSLAEVLDALRSRLAHLGDRRKGIAMAQAAQQPLFEHVNALFDYSLVSIDTQIEWLKTFVARLDAGEVAWPEGSPGKELEHDRQDQA
jgi:DNA-binding PadR family transcriptional regulator